MKLDTSSLRIGVLMPEVLGTYGDSGNAVVLSHRARLVGIDAQVINIGVTQPIPDQLDIYTLGGGEDVAQTIAARCLRGDKGLYRAVQKGAPVLAICAAMQVLGSWYIDSQGKQEKAAELLDVITLPQGARAIGELISTPANTLCNAESKLSDKLSGFENHGGATLLGKDAQPLGFVLSGTGNGKPGVIPQQPDGVSAVTGKHEGKRLSTEIPSGYRAEIDGKTVDGAVQGSIIATYMHGPVLARNPQLADYILSQATGKTIAAPDIAGNDRLRKERFEYSGVAYTNKPNPQ